MPCQIAERTGIGDAATMTRPAALTWPAQSRQHCLFGV